MRQRTRKGPGQSVVEYAVLFSVVAAVVIGMQLYVKRGMQAKVKRVSDYLTEQESKDGHSMATKAKRYTQYEPYYTAAGTIGTTSHTDADEAMTTGGKVARTKISDETKRTGSTKQGVDMTQDDGWKLE